MLIGIENSIFRNWHYVYILNEWEIQENIVKFPTAVTASFSGIDVSMKGSLISWLLFDFEINTTLLFSYD